MLRPATVIKYWAADTLKLGKEIIGTADFPQASKHLMQRRSELVPVDPALLRSINLPSMSRQYLMQVGLPRESFAVDLTLDWPPRRLASMTEYFGYPKSFEQYRLIGARSDIPWSTPGVPLKVEEADYIKDGVPVQFTWLVCLDTEGAGRVVMVPRTEPTTARAAVSLISSSVPQFLQALRILRHGWIWYEVANLRVYTAEGDVSSWMQVKKADAVRAGISRFGQPLIHEFFANDTESIIAGFWLDAIRNIRGSFNFDIVDQSNLRLLELAIANWTASFWPRYNRNIQQCFCEDVFKPARSCSISRR
jgi:hypothetical protein